MAKLFYTLEEAAQKLRKSTDEVMAMARSGQLQELKDKDQVLFRRSAIDQLAAEDDSTEISLENFDAGSSGSDIRLGGSSVGLGGEDDLKLGGNNDLKLDDGDGLSLEPHGAGAPAMPPASMESPDDSMMIGLSDSGPHAAPAAPAFQPPADTSDITLGDSQDSMMADLPGAGRGNQATQAGGESGIMDGGNPSLETVGSGSGLLDISSDESFFGAQMIEDSMGADGEGAAALPGGGVDIFGGADAGTSEEATPVTAGTSGVTFGTTALAEARDPAFSGFTAGAMLVVALGLVAMAWATVELSLGGYSQIGKMLTENALIVLAALGGGTLFAGIIGLFIGKATA